MPRISNAHRLWNDLDRTEQTCLATLHEINMGAEKSSATLWTERATRQNHFITAYRKGPADGLMSRLKAAGVQHKDSDHAFRALSMRGLVEASDFDGSLIVRITHLGRRVAGAGMGTPKPPKRPPRFLTERRWRMLEALHTRGERGAPEGIGNLDEAAFLKHPDGPLIEYYDVPWNETEDYEPTRGVRLSARGRTYVKQNRAAYAALYSPE